MFRNGFGRPSTSLLPIERRALCLPAKSRNESDIAIQAELEALRRELDEQERQLKAADSECDELIRLREEQAAQTAEISLRENVVIPELAKQEALLDSLIQHLIQQKEQYEFNAENVKGSMNRNGFDSISRFGKRRDDKSEPMWPDQNRRNCAQLPFPTPKTSPVTANSSDVRDRTNIDEPRKERIPFSPISNPSYNQNSNKNPFLNPNQPHYATPDDSAALFEKLWGVKPTSTPTSQPQIVEWKEQPITPKPAFKDANLLPDSVASFGSSELFGSQSGSCLFFVTRPNEEHRH